MKLPVVKIPVGLQGWFVVELIDAKTQQVKQRLEFPNLITDAGLDYIGSHNVGLNDFMANGWCAVGTNSTTPANTDTGLGTEVSPSSTNRTQSNGGFGMTSSYTAGPPDYHSQFRTWLFLETQGNGNLTEIGIFSANTVGTMWTHQLLKDSGGTPTTVTKTSSDQLRVIYELRCQPPQSDVTGSVTISTVSYSYTIRPIGVGNAAYWGLFHSNNWWGGTNFGGAYELSTLAIRTATNPSGTLKNNSSYTVATYTAGNKYRDVSAVWNPADGNFTTGIGLVVFLDIANQARLLQLSVSPSFLKDNTMRLTLVFRISWDRV